MNNLGWPAVYFLPGHLFLFIVKISNYIIIYLSNFFEGGQKNEKNLIWDRWLERNYSR
ncbi:hypothetical protein Calkro_0617 [Caldicellulosiruptor kronotskyensis 2002]|uniref:Uncharacterized protein n=1 Tax=Caldicellulosiruptor kronotskyensis (strain DSM 18902 / VKM B-2412 / 2002) TaxID=632348 RepID=E4SEM4_CALK2|nr:hypothetical protein Calkro_0617 [Caldicellulosiruptor kronotskyensis 2002]